MQNFSATKRMLDRLAEMIKNAESWTPSLQKGMDAAMKELEAGSGDRHFAPVGSFHISEQQVGATTDYVRDGEWPIDNGELLVYAQPQPYLTVPPALSIDDVIVRVSRELNAKWTGRMGYLTGYNACRSDVLKGEYFPPEVDGISLLAAHRVMGVFANRLSMPGGDPQLLASVQCEVTAAIREALCIK